MYGISSQSKEQIDKVVSDLFDKAALRLLGNIPKLQNKKVMLIGFEQSASIANLFVQAMNNKWLNGIENEVLKGVLTGASNYIDILKNKTSNNIVQKLEGLARESRSNNEKIEEIELNKIIEEELGKARTDLETIALSESTKARNLGMVMDISRAAASTGDMDPVIGFAGINDGATCKECIRLFLMPDGVTPRLWRMSECSAGYFKRGDAYPSILGLHPRCFTGSQKIATDMGLISFQELFNNQHKPKVLVDYRIMNMRENGNQFGSIIPGKVRLDPHSKVNSRFEQASSVYDTGVQEVVRITLDSGHELEVSLNHEMWTETGNAKWEKIEAYKLGIGDKIPLITKGESFGYDHFPIHAELMGNLMGDGCINPNDNRAQWNFFGNDIPYGNFLYELTKEISPSLMFLDKLTVVPPDKLYNVSRTSFKSQALGDIFVNEFGLTKKPKRVPARLFKADKKTVAAFLRGIYAADGHSEPGNAVITQNDLQFLIEIQQLLSMFGLISRIYPHGEGGKQSMYSVDRTERIVNRKPCFRLTVGGSCQFDRFVEEIGFGVPIKQKRAINNKTEGSPTRGYWRTAKISKIENIGMCQTYCLTEPMTNTIAVNGVVTGQCRHTPFLVPDDWGFDKNGHLTFKSIGHDALEEQRS